MKIAYVADLLIASLCLVLVAGAGWAGGPHATQDDASGDVPSWADRATWTTYLDAEHGFVIDLPAGVRLEPRSGVWYAQIYGENGEPQIPALSFSFMRDTSAEEVLARDFPDLAAVEEVTLGPGTRGLRVRATYETEVAGRYRETSYLAYGPEGVYVFRLWESLSFAPFDAVVQSFTRVERVR